MVIEPGPELTTKSAQSYSGEHFALRDVCPSPVDVTVQSVVHSVISALKNPGFATRFGESVPQGSMSVVVVEVLIVVLSSMVDVTGVNEVTNVVMVDVEVDVEVLVALTVIVVDGASAVIVTALMPMHEQALAYLTAPEQADAYAGTLLGTTVTWRFAGACAMVVLVNTSVTTMVDVDETMTVVGEVTVSVSVVDAATISGTVAETVAV